MLAMNKRFDERFDQLLKLHEESARATTAFTTGKEKENLTPKMGETLIWRVLQYLEISVVISNSTNLRCQSLMALI